MRFLVDAQLPPALVSLLRERGHTAQHVTDVGPCDASDREIWEFAVEHQAAIITKDQDFCRMAATAAGPPVVVWIRLGNTRRAALLDWFAPLLDRVVAAAEEGQRVIELR